MCTVLLLAAAMALRLPVLAGEQTTGAPGSAGEAVIDPASSASQKIGEQDNGAIPLPAGAQDNGTVPLSGQDNGTVPLPVKEEVVYASLAADGRAQEAYIVNIFNVKTAGRIEDRGAYAAVKNLTTEAPITLAGETVTAEAAAGDFYYQGNMAQPKLPWIFEITYRLDGKEVKPDLLGGQSGRLEIAIRTIPNAEADPGWADNCMIQTQITLDAARCREIDAGEGMIANAGANKLITYTTMPGKEGDILLSAQVNGFIMPGIQFAATPLKMSIGDIDTSEMTGDLTELTDAIADLDKGVGEMRDGVLKLQDGAAAYSTGTYNFQQGLGQAAAGGAELKAGSQAIEDGLAALSGGLGQAVTGIGNLPIQPATTTAIDQIVQGLSYGGAITSGAEDDVKSAMTGLVNGIILAPGGLYDGLNGLSGGLSALSGQYKTFDDGLGAYTGGVSQAAAGAGGLTYGAVQFESGLAEFVDGVKKLKDGTAEMRSETAGMGDKIQEKIDELMAEYDKSDYVPLSFASPENGTIHALQFVIQTDPIEEPAAPAPEEKEAGKESILDRLFALFGAKS
jgi:hypothetical protein